MYTYIDYIVLGLLGCIIFDLLSTLPNVIRDIIEFPFVLLWKFRYFSIFIIAIFLIWRWHVFLQLILPLLPYLISFSLGILFRLLCRLKFILEQVAIEKQAKKIEEENMKKRIAELEHRLNNKDEKNNDSSSIGIAIGVLALRLFFKSFK